MAGKVKLTEAQIGILAKMAKGQRIHFSSDGDCGWLSGENKHLDDKDIWALRNAHFIIMVGDEREDHYGCEEITDSGRAHLASSEKGD